MNLLIAIVYTILFIWIISKGKFYRESGLSTKSRIALFLVKSAAGMLLVYIYIYHYKNTNTSDILAFQKDGLIITNAFFKHPTDFFKIIFGIANDDPRLHELYFSKMEKWFRIHDALFFNDCRTIIRFNAITNLITFKSIYANTIIMCFLSFTGLMAFYRTFKSLFIQKEKLFIIAIFLCPSLLFWSSGVLKEGLLIFSLGLFTYSTTSILYKKEYTLINFTLVILTLFLLVVNKLYVFLCFIPPFFIYILLRKNTVKLSFFIYLILQIVLFTGGFYALKLCCGKDIGKELIDKQRDFINIAKGGIYLNRDTIIVRMEYDLQNQLIPTKTNKDCVYIATGSKYEYWLNEKLYDTLKEQHSPENKTVFFVINKLEPARSAFYMPHLQHSFQSFMQYSPVAFTNVLFRPWPNETENLYQAIISIENIVYLFLFLVALLLGDYKNLNAAFFWMCLFFCINLFLIIGFTTPVAGALVRYKSPALPFLLMAAFSLISVEKAKRIPLLKHLVG